MPVLVLLAVVIFLIVAVLIWLSFGLLGLIFHLVIAGLVGALADAIVPGELPFGWLGAIVAGLLGSWIGVQLLGSIGPTVSNIPLVSALIGAIIFAFVADLVLKATAGRRVA
ncbi:MAG: GlsB/YeaQ/YmgE family stress response membrane protein [Chloroflexi bacterium]|nr:GlsB/YeaQ/YmgE family stress response membrane protein [Chloroflexota bacterium]